MQADQNLTALGGLADDAFGLRDLRRLQRKIPSVSVELEASVDDPPVPQPRPEGASPTSKPVPPGPDRGALTSSPLKLLGTPLPAVALVPTEELEQMTTLIDRARRPSLTGVYLAVLIAALLIVAAIWLSTDNNAGTNSLATDEKAMTRVP
jgi:hypothetical protein